MCYGKITNMVTTRHEPTDLHTYPAPTTAGLLMTAALSGQIVVDAAGGLDEQLVVRSQGVCGCEKINH